MPKVKTLDRKRADYLCEKRALYEALYRGGHRIEKRVDEILPQRPMESKAFWALRKQSFHYLPRAAQILDELTGTVFQGDLEVLPCVEKGKERPELPPFYAEFFEDPIGGNPKTKLVDVFFMALVRAQVHRDHFIQVIFPDLEFGENASRADQDAAGALRAKLRHVEADAVFDFAEDEAGLVWVKIATKIEDQEPLLDDEQRTDLYRWQVIDRQKITTYELRVKCGEIPKPELEVPELRSVTHRWAKVGRVPVVRVSIGDDVWIMDRIGSMVLAETRKRNALNWLEDLCCYPQPVHKGDETLKDKREADPSQNSARGAAVFFEIGEKDELDYLEPEGGSLEHLAKRLDAMGHDIATVIHQAASAVGPDAAKQVESAASKVRDSVAKRLLAGCYADDIRKAAAEVVGLVAIGRAEDLKFEAIGLEQHDIADVSEAATEAVSVQAVNVPSESFRKRYQKRFIRRVLPGEPDEEYRKMDTEIDGSKPEEVDPFAADTALSLEAKQKTNELIGKDQGEKGPAK